ncbi:MAG: hypothetical protein IPK93_09170 [Solirubrobacterales bacterium]|nr:hypothetical protein [Solirubrobacterales bacterium]
MSTRDRIMAKGALEGPGSPPAVDVDAMELIGDIEDFLRRFLVMSDDQFLVVTLWVIHTYIVKSIEQTPYLLISSPLKQCGKSRLLDALGVLVFQPWPAVLPSEAVVYRHIDSVTPTLLLDEVDTIFQPAHRRAARRPEGIAECRAPQRDEGPTLRRSKLRDRGVLHVLRESARRNRGAPRYDRRPRNPDQA